MNMEDLNSPSSGKNYGNDIYMFIYVKEYSISCIFERKTERNLK